MHERYLGCGNLVIVSHCSFLVTGFQGCPSLPPSFLSLLKRRGRIDIAVETLIEVHDMSCHGMVCPIRPSMDCFCVELSEASKRICRWDVP